MAYLTKFITHDNIADVIWWLGNLNIQLYTNTFNKEAILPLCEFIYYKKFAYYALYNTNTNQTINFFSNHSTYLYKINHYVNYSNYTQFEILKMFKTYTMSLQNHIA